MNRPLLWAMLVVVLAQAFRGIYSIPWVWDGIETIDGDIALRFDRVMELYAGGQWYDSIAERLDAPFGELIAWSRPLDLILYAGAALGSVFTDFRSALILWGVLLSPALMLAALPMLQRMLLPALGPVAVLPAAAILILQQSVMMVFSVGRADHHSLMAVLLIALMLALSVAARGNTSLKPALWAGLVTGFACWVSVESMVAAVFGGAGWLMLWIWENDRRRLHQALLYAGVASAILVVAVGVEHPPQDWFRELHAKVSIVHLALAVLATAAVAALLLLDRVRPTDCALCRGTRAALAMNAAAIVAVLLFPALLKGPLAADGASTSMWHLQMVGEFRPLWPVDYRSALHLGLPLIAACASVILFRRVAGPERKVLALCLLGLLIYVPLSLAQVRWSNYANIIMILPLLMAVHHIMESRLRFRAGVSAALLVSPVFVAVGLNEPDEKSLVDVACDQTAILRHLGQNPPSADQDILLTYVSDGPEVIWNSRYRVVASNYLFDTAFGKAVAAFKSQSDEVARQLAIERGVHFVLVCAGNREGRLYRLESGTSFHDRLAAGEAPAWLEPVPLPQHLAPHRMYRTVNP